MKAFYVSFVDFNVSRRFFDVRFLIVLCHDFSSCLLTLEVACFSRALV